MAIKEEKPKLDKEELAKIVGKHENAEKLTKSVAIIKGPSQFTIRLPTKFVELAKVNPEEDEFEFVLIPVEKEGRRIFTIEAHLKKGKNE